MAFPGDIYAPPSVYTRTLFENPVAGALAGLKIPVIIGEGNEYLSQPDLEMVRGSSANVDQKITQEDETGRAVVNVTLAGVVTLGNFDGVIDRFQVRNFPIVSGNGTGTTTNNRSDVTVQVDGQVIVVLSVNGTNGIVKLAQPPKLGQLVRCTYYFNRTDTLITDDVSSQVDPDPAVVQALVGIGDVNAQNPTVPPTVLNIHGDILNSGGQVVVPANNVLIVTVDGTQYTMNLPSRVDYTMAQVATTISSYVSGTLTAGTFINNFGLSTLQLNADNSLVIGSGSANAILGLQAGQADNRIRTFYTYQGPIVDGSDGGVTTTDPANVTVKVDGRQVIPTAVDGAHRAVVLPVAPKAGAKVAITYWFNTWQDTFDYLANIGVVSVARCGEIPGASTFIEGADFILKDDKIVWGASALVSSGTHTVGADFFGESQITTTLIDNKTFLAETTSVFTTSGVLAQASQTDFLLPFTPTLGNGRDTKLGQSLYQSIANNRIDVPVNRPDVVDAYWGYDVQDALERGKVTVTKVEGNVITLKSPIPVGTKVFATFWYNRLTDNTYTVSSVIPGPSGTGSYQITDGDGTQILNPSFNIATKGTALNGITLEFPSGSELRPDLRHEPVSDNLFKGPVQEVVTVTFASRPATPARYTAPGVGDYQFIENKSDRLRVVIDGTENGTPGFGTAGMDLSTPSSHDNGFWASLVGNEVEYTGGSGAVVGQSYEFASNENFNLLIDGVTIGGQVPADSGVPHDVSYIAQWLNEAASGHASTAAATEILTSLITLDPAKRSSIDEYYVGWKVVIGTAAGLGITPAQSATVLSYVGATGVATVDAPWVGGTTFVTLGDEYYIYNPTAMAQYKSATRFDGSVALTLGEYERLSFVYYGSVSGPSLTVSTTAGALAAGSPYTTAATLAAAIETEMNAAGVSAGLSGSAGSLPGLEFFCSADADGRLIFKVQPAPSDLDGGALLFIDGVLLPVPIPPANDLAILAGLSTGDTTVTAWKQVALLQGTIARSYLYTSVTGEKPYDRLILRNRLLPGNSSTGSVPTADAVAQMQLSIQAGSANTKAGLVTGMYGQGWDKAVVHPATMLSRIGFSGGQVTTYGDARDGQPLVTFYDGTGTQAQNNVFDFVLDGVPVPWTFTDDAGAAVAGAGSSVPLGPGNAANTVIGQISNALYSIPGNPFGFASAVDAFNQGIVSQEGAGIRLRSTISTSASLVQIGSGNANTVLRFTTGAVAQRTLVTAKQTASALMSNYNSSGAAYLFWTAAAQLNYFANLGLASVAADGTGGEYLYVQSLQSIVSGAGTSVQFKAAALGLDALYPGTGLNIPTGDGESGEAALDGFFVKSNNLAAGSGTANDSVLNPLGTGKGSDGVVGQTYRDKVTGLTFTILPRGFNTNPSGPWLSYPTGPNAYFYLNVTGTFITDANLPHNALNGVELTVSNTSNVPAGDSALVETFNRGGLEPAISDIYYVTYTYLKQDYTTAFYTKMSAIEASYGAISPDNPVSLAAYLAIINGAVVVGIKQVPREPGSNYASLATYVQAIEELEGALPGNAIPDIITPLRGDSTELYLILRRSNSIMSSIRYKSERTSIIGMSAGSLPKDAQNLAQTLNDVRMRLVYPDIATVSIQDALGISREYLIDGPMLAVGLVGSVVSANVDVATPWTGRLLVGYSQLARKLDAVEQNQIAVKGVTILEERLPYLRVRQGLTTNMENVLTKTPTIIMVSDEVQRQARVTLETFIGIKFLPGILSQIEGRLSMMLKSLVKKQIIAAYTGVSATVSPDDPTTAEVAAYYQPVFPLLYLLVTFHLRSTL